jgi:DNA ligase 1
MPWFGHVSVKIQSRNREAPVTFAPDLNGFAALLDRLAYEPRRNAKIDLLARYFADVPDPERGFALAVITGSLSFHNAKSGLVRALIANRTDPVLFGLSYDYVGDLSETVALLWPKPLEAPRRNSVPTLYEVIETLGTGHRIALADQVAGWLDALDETGRWALLKLITGSLRIGVSARIAKIAVAKLGGKEADAIEKLWFGLAPPYEDLFAWLEGRGPEPAGDDPTPFRPVMLAHPIEDRDFDAITPDAFVAEWKWDGIRIQAAVARDADGGNRVRLYSRTGDDISGGFPDLVAALAFDGAIDGELLILREGLVQNFNVLQQRLNRKSVTPKLIAEFPATIRAYDLLFDGKDDVRDLPFTERRKRLEAIVAAHGGSSLDLSPLVPFETIEDLVEARSDPSRLHVLADHEAIEGLMLKRKASAYLPGRPRGQWYKWKRDPRLIDAVLMYAQRGHGKRSSFYSDFTFGVWRGDQLTPVGKAYFGFTDEELAALDRYIRKNTGQRFGPVREVLHGKDRGLVLEVAFEGLQRSTRHKSGVAMRFPRISRIRWDKPAHEADHLETLEAMLGAS